ncbi:type II toxin-antitoxin system RelE/ParE family toxin [Pararcticibacter amylolyticus]|uniref:Addiction module toxin RelE n=1 Tax=Pararcticibacter amylolyticus TaxID=2173175 RepID=A0A2U2PLA3_9SPHI|nr:hypothetical protein [Pararcticibacter amylolyticus]PWG82108.1 hypothetical protein DDR33_03580 [Pararcticibacter amylolyticus]
MSFNINVTSNFLRELKQLSRKYPSLKKDLADLAKELEQHPYTGIHLGHNLYKIRLAITSKGRGKSGGARIISYVISKDGDLWLISIYDKAQYDTADIETLIEIINSEGL